MGARDDAVEQEGQLHIVRDAELGVAACGWKARDFAQIVLLQENRHEHSEHGCTNSTNLQPYGPCTCHKLARPDSQYAGKAKEAFEDEQQRSHQRSRSISFATDRAGDGDANHANEAKDEDEQEARECRGAELWLLGGHETSLGALVPEAEAPPR